MRSTFSYAIRLKYFAEDIEQIFLLVGVVAKITVCQRPQWHNFRQTKITNDFFVATLQFD
jgi:hypothetical protein